MSLLGKTQSESYGIPAKKSTVENHIFSAPRCLKNNDIEKVGVF